MSRTVLSAFVRIPPGLADGLPLGGETPPTAAVTFERPLSFQEVRAFLERFDVRPIAVHLEVAGAGFTYRARPDHATDALNEAREEAFDAALRTLCDPGAVSTDLDLISPTPITLAMGRAMLSRLEQSRRSMTELIEDAPTVYGVTVAGEGATPQRLGAASEVARVDPWSLTTRLGVEQLVGPEPEAPIGGPARLLFPWIEALAPGDLDLELQRAANTQRTECGRWRERRIELG